MLKDKDLKNLDEKDLKNLTHKFKGKFQPHHLTFIIFKVILYPIFYIAGLIRIILDKNPNAIKFFKCFISTVLLFIWIGAFLLFDVGRNVIELIFLGGTTVTLIEEEYIKPSTLDYGDLEGADGSTTDPSSAVTTKDGQYIIDLSKIDANTKVTLPSNVYQNGTVQQRAEILMIVQEICARPEITISPQELLGIWYSESTAYIGCPGSVLTTTWEVEYNAYDCGGPFQHAKGAWEGKDLYRGRAFISSLEDPDLPDDQRVQTSDTCTETIDGLKRPSMFCFSDAAYSAALRYSGTYSGNSTYDYADHVTGMLSWADSQGMDEYQKTILRNVGSCGYYNGYTESVKTYIPSMYADIYKQHGKLDQWSGLAGNRSSLNNKLKELASNTDRVTGDYKGGGKQSYADAVANGNWQSTQFVFVSYNGGKYVHDGLESMAKQLGSTKTGDSASISGSYAKIKAEAEKWFGVPYALPGDPQFKGEPKTFNCSSYVCWVYQKSGIKPNMAPTSAQGIFDSYCTKISESEVQPGDLIFFTKTYYNGRTITHVGIVAGNGEMMHAGDPVGKTSYETPYWKEHFYCFGRPK